MEKTFTYNGLEMKASWNGKAYRGVRYVNVKAVNDRYGKGTNMIWDDACGWTKNGGMPYVNEVRDMFGFK